MWKIKFKQCHGKKVYHRRTGIQLYILNRKKMMQNKKTAKPDTTDKKPNPLTKKDIQQNPDNRIDQDFPGYPHAPASKEIIKPETEVEKKIADTDNKDGEKRNYKKKLKE
jgi:hypothetical protein